VVGVRLVLQLSWDLRSPDPVRHVQSGRATLEPESVRLLGTALLSMRWARSAGAELSSGRSAHCVLPTNQQNERPEALLAEKFREKNEALNQSRNARNTAKLASLARLRGQSAKRSD
jgi:hypothetical protein